MANRRGSGQLWRTVPAGDGWYSRQTRFLESQGEPQEGLCLGEEFLLPPAGNVYSILQTMLLEAEKECL